MIGERLMEYEPGSLKYAREIVAKDPYAQFLGIEAVEICDSYAKMKLTVKPEYCNSVGRAHGAIVYGAADQAFAVACNSRGEAAMALTVTMHYHAGAQVGTTLISEAEPVSIHRKVSLWRLTVKTEEGILIATAEGTAYHR